MRVDLVKWELSILLKDKNTLEVHGRDFSYDERNRISVLRNFLDSIEVSEQDENDDDKKGIETNRLDF